jgi:NAD(P)-dependent dehydrogenase (short-subunit alcohol dehydrogenase family)
MQDPDLSGRTAMVTGAGRGIGRATAIELARCGARVVLTARNEAQIDAVAREIREAGGDAIAIPCDVAVRSLVEELFREAPPTDVLVANAGVIHPIAPLLSADADAWLYNIAVNLGGVFLSCRFAVPGMVERGWGRIVVVSSGGAKGTTIGWGAYAAGKAGVEAMTRVLALEVADSGVMVNAIRPGILDTEMQVEIRSSSEGDFGKANLERYWRYKERGMLRDPRDAAKLILWLLSPEAEGLNGEVLNIDDAEVAEKIGSQPMGR